MKTLFINEGESNGRFTIQSVNGQPIGNEGPEGAVNDIDGTTTICLAPSTQVDLEATTGGEVELDGTFAIQIDGVFVPYYFTAEQLGEYFNGSNSNNAGIAFRPTGAN